jgi:hypothetical protein
MDVPATLPERRYISNVLAHCPINSRRVFTSGGVKCNRHVRLRLAKLLLKIESRIFNNAERDKASMIKVAPAQLKRLVRDLEYSGGQGVCRNQWLKIKMSWQAEPKFSVDRFHGSGEP